MQQAFCLSFFYNDLFQDQTGILFAGKINCPVAAEYQQAAAAVIFQKLCIRAKIQIAQITGVTVDQSDFLIRQCLHPQIYAVLVLHTVLEYFQLQTFDWSRSAVMLCLLFTNTVSN